MFKFSILIFTLYLNSSLADLNKLKKVTDCVCYCPKEDTSSKYKNDKITVENSAISQSIPGGQTKKVDYNYINLPGKSNFVTHYHQRNSTSRSSTRKTNRKTNRKTTKVTKKKYSKKQISMIQRAGENLIKRYQNQARLGYRSNMGTYFNTNDCN